MLESINARIQDLLLASRWLILVIVLSGIFSSFLMIVIGTIEVYNSFVETVHALFSHKITVVGQVQHIITGIISSIDAYLISTVLILFSIGLYELFISKIKKLNARSTSGNILAITSLDQLKEKLGKVIIMILIVSFFKSAINFKINQSLDVLYLGTAILFVALALFFTHGEAKQPKSPAKDKA